MKPRSNALLWMIHVLSWTYIFLSPLFFTPQNVPVDWRHIMSREFFSLALLLTFYSQLLSISPEVFPLHPLSHFLSLQHSSHHRAIRTL